MKTSKTKTFKKDEPYEDVLEWVMNQFETNDWQPEGTEWIEGEPTPHDPRCDLKHKYILTITKVES